MALAVALLASCAAAPGAGAAGWLPSFDVGANVTEVHMTPGGDMVVMVDLGRTLRFRPSGGPLGPPEAFAPSGASSIAADVDAAGNTYLVWTRAGALEARVRRRDGSLTPIQTIDPAAVVGSVAVSRDGRATFAWIGSDANRTGLARTRRPDGTLDPSKTVTAPAEKTREIEVDVDADGDATFVWTTPEAPPNTKVKARTLGFAGQTLSAIHNVSLPPSPELSDSGLVAVDPAGNATLVWRHIAGPPFAALVETRVLSAAGALSATQVLTSAGQSSQGHDVAVDDAGSARIAWAEHASGTSDPFLPVTCFSNLGSSCGAFATLSSSPTLWMSVAKGPAGDAIVGWASPSGAAAEARVIPSGQAPLPAHTLSPAAGLPELAMDAEGNGVAAWREDGPGRAAGYDAVPPAIRRLSVPPVAERGVPLALSADVFDVWGATGRWSFGDGAAAAGLSVTHVFEHTGIHRVNFTATDGTGAARSAAAQISVRDTRGPALGRVSMKRRRFRPTEARTPVVARKLRRAARRGSDFRFTLGEDATVRIAIARRVAGRRVRGRCRPAGRRRVSRRSRCTRHVRAGPALRRTLGAGRKRVRFSGRIGRRALRPGRYRASVRAVDASGNRSRLRRVRFTVVRR